MTLEEIIPNAEVDKAFENCHFGSHGNRRRVIREALLKKICSVQLTVQEELIIYELKLVVSYRSTNSRLTVRAKQYLYLSYSYESYLNEIKMDLAS